MSKINKYKACGYTKFMHCSFDSKKANIITTAEGSMENFCRNRRDHTSKNK